MENKKIIGYRCIENYYDLFTKGKIYHLNPGKSFNDFDAFIDDKGDNNGWNCRNHEHFEPVYEEVNNILPEKWCIIGNRELADYLKTVNNNPDNLKGFNPLYQYFINNSGIWCAKQAIKGFEKITLQQYLNSINNKMESKKIYYLKQEVKLNQEIDFNGLKIKVTQDLIDNNPNLFQIEEEVKKDVGHFIPDKKLVLCVENYDDRYKKGEVYVYYIGLDQMSFGEGWIHYVNYNENCQAPFDSKTFNKHFVVVDIIKYYKNSDGFIHKYYINVDSNGNNFAYDINGDIRFTSSISHNILSLQISTVKEYNKQQEIIKNLPKYIKDNESGNIFKTEYKPNETYPIKYVAPKHITQCSNNFNYIIKYYTPSTKEEYDKQEELQQLLDEAQKRYPVGTKLSKDLTVTLHPDNKTYLVYPDKCVKVYIGDNEYSYVKADGIVWCNEYKEPVKDLNYYENKSRTLIMDTAIRLFHPNLYYQFILQNIADDLNGDWKANRKPDWNESKSSCWQFFIYYGYNSKKFNISVIGETTRGEIVFKSKELAQQAIDIMGEDKLKIIFNIK